MRSQRAERSIVVTTNLLFKQWDTVFPNASCAVALIDRLTHHAEIIPIEGESYRKREAELAQKKRRAAPVSGAAEPSVDSVSRFCVSSTSVTLGGPTVAFSRAALNRLAYATRLHLFRLISPSNVPSPVTLPPGAKSIVSNSIIVNVPVAPANRPVPFSIVATFVSLALFGGMKTP
jgi:hypothetical protein